MNDLICRLRENQYNNLEDVLLEASDRTSGDASELFKLCSQRLPKAVEEAKGEIFSSAEDTSDRFDEGFDAGIDEVTSLLDERIDEAVAAGDDEAEELLGEIREKVRQINV